MINQPDTLKKWQRILEGPLYKYLLGKYPKEMNTYNRFRRTTGPHCAFCKASARLIFKEEAVSKKDFLESFKDNNWNGYIRS